MRFDLTRTLSAIVSTEQLGTLREGNSIVFLGVDLLGGCETKYQKANFSCVLVFAGARSVGCNDEIGDRDYNLWISERLGSFRAMSQIFDLR